MKNNDINRRRTVKADPEVYFRKAFGKNFEFSEKYLTANIKHQLIIKAIKRRYGFLKVTKSTLKHILYEGARLNRVLRINDSWFEKMIDVLRIPLDEDIEEENEESDSQREDDDLWESVFNCYRHLPKIKVKHRSDDQITKGMNAWILICLNFHHLC